MKDDDKGQGWTQDLISKLFAREKERQWERERERKLSHKLGQNPTARISRPIQ